MIITVLVEDLNTIADPKYVVYEGLNAIVYTETDIPLQVAESTALQVDKTRLRLALLHFECLDEVENIVATSNDKQLQILWETQDYFWSNHPKVVQMGALLQLPITEIFLYAQSIDISTIN